MNTKRLGEMLILLGIALLVVSLLWWGVFYNEVARAIGGKITDTGSCLYSNGGPCALIAGGAQMLGKFPYTPVVFWAAIGALVSGILLNATSPVASATSKESTEAEPVARVCPFCAETIQPAAKICRHCQRELPGATAP